MGVSLGHLTQPNMPDNPEIWKAAAMADHFEKIQKLPDPVVGCPNFRRIPGYKVYCCKCAIPANQLKLARKFAAFMEDNKKLIDLCETGKGNLQWERDIPPAALSNLENLAKGDFKANLGKIIHDIYQTAHVMFADMPQGDHKKRAKYRFASKTLMRILPADKKTEVEGLIEKKTITLDLYEILGQCTWGQ